VNPRCIERVRSLRAAVLARRGHPLAKIECLADVRRVLVILTAPRAGSSLLAALLRCSSQTVALYAQHDPQYRLQRLGFPHRGLTSDAFGPLGDLDADLRQSVALEFLTGLQLGGTAQTVPAEDYVHQLALHLPLQWPHLEFEDADAWLGVIRGALRRARAAGRAPSPSGDHDCFFIEFLCHLRRSHPEINPYYYDLPKHLVAARFPEVEPPAGPPNDCCLLEIPPFVALKPQRVPTREQLRRRPLVLKTLPDAHHPRFLEQLFPHAEVGYIHLTRNPAASINGLYDGWRDRGFFSYNLAEHGPLAITGYSEQAPWARSWWKFQLPPGWQDLKSRPLEYVCGYQWCSAHRDILAMQGAHPTAKLYRLSYESLIESEASRNAALHDLLGFFDMEPDDPLRTRLNTMPAVNAVVSPRPFRWHRRRETLWPFATQRHILETAKALGYGIEAQDRWL
jgi:hypothetical protein